MLGIFPRLQLVKHQIQRMKLKTETNMLKISEDKSEINYSQKSL